MTDGYINGWLLKAENDLKLAAHELKLEEEEMVTDAICFHCQQAAEKLLKAFLISRGVEFSRSHDLEYLDLKRLFWKSYIPINNVDVQLGAVS